MDRLFELSRRLIERIDSTFVRYLYNDINWNNRLIGLTGPRGVGKTTMVLQHIKQSNMTNEALYVTAEDFYFAEHKIVDLADSFVKMGGKYLFIDEIHKYDDWARELKLIYDYHSELNVVFTGSSVLDLKKGSADLSRRAVLYHLQGLSFREYLLMFHGISSKTYELDEILNHEVKIAELNHPLTFFEKYLKHGYYPFSKEDDFDIRLRQILNHTMMSDIPIYANMNVSTGRKLIQLLSIISKSVPFKPNMSKIAQMLSISRNNVSDYLMYLEEAGLIAQLRDDTSGIRGLGKVDKIYMDNTNLIYNIGDESANIGNIRETFFLNQLRVKHEIISSEAADFKVKDYTFEVGGKNKGSQQIQGIENGFIVKDDIELGMMNIIPLWMFGMTY